MNKKLNISVPVLIVIIISVIITTKFMNDKTPNIDPNFNQDTSEIEPEEKDTEMKKIYAYINNEKLEINLEENSATSSLLKLLPLDLTMTDLNNNEKYVYLDETLPTDTYSPEHIEAGDVMLFDDNCLVIFYESFDTNFDYTKIGHIDNLPELDDNEIKIKLSNE